jgi:hypothetical protein
VKLSRGLSACSSTALSGVADRALEKIPTAGLAAGGAGVRPAGAAAAAGAAGAAAVGGFAGTGGATTATSVFFSFCSRSRAMDP